MSIEKAPEINRPEDLEAASALLEENRILSKDTYARDVLEKGGRTSSGKVVDIGDFLAAREAYLEDDADKIAAMGEKNPVALREAMIVHSVRPDLEEK